MVTGDEQRKRDQAYNIRAAESFQRFSGQDNLIFGLRLSSISLKIVQDLVMSIIENET